MARPITALKGLCYAAIARGVRGGVRDFYSASIAAERAARNLASEELRSIPIRTLDELLKGKKPEIHLCVQAYEEGMLPSDQLLILLALLVVHGPSVVLEIGTFMGHTTKAMAMNLPESTIHTVDLPLNFVTVTDSVQNLIKDDFHLIANRRVGREFSGTEHDRRIHQHFSDTAVWNFGIAAGATFFFIDGAHTYEYCKNDSEKCLDLCNGKGLFLWHDCNATHPGVVQFLLEWRALGRNIIRIGNTPLAYWNCFDF